MCLCLCFLCIHLLQVTTHKVHFSKSGIASFDISSDCCVQFIQVCCVRNDGGTERGAAEVGEARCEDHCGVSHVCQHWALHVPQRQVTAAYLL